MFGDYRKLSVWQKSMKLVGAVYALANEFPLRERFGLAQQVQRAAISIPSNIAEGRRRATERDYHHFLQIAFGSGAELETQIEIAVMLGYGTENNIQDVRALLGEVMRMLNALLTKTNE